MTALRLSLTLLTVTLLPLTAAAQDAPPSVRTAAACAPVAVAASSGAPRVVALPPADATHLRKTIYAPGERVGLSQGTADGIVSGGRYVVRRPMRSFGAPRAQHTIGWIHVTDAAASSATAEIDFACDAVAVGDVVEPATEVQAAAGVTRPFTGGALDFERSMRVTYGTDGSIAAGRPRLRPGRRRTGTAARRSVTAMPCSLVGERWQLGAVCRGRRRRGRLRGAVGAAHHEARDGVLRRRSTRAARRRIRSRIAGGERAVSTLADHDGYRTFGIRRGRRRAVRRRERLQRCPLFARSSGQTVTFEDVSFNLDRHTLRPEAKKRLDEAVKTLHADPTLRIQVEGHTCNIGTAEYNLTLGEHRAGAVRAYLVEKGIAENRLTTVSYGEERPAHDNRPPMVDVSIVGPS